MWEARERLVLTELTLGGEPPKEPPTPDATHSCIRCVLPAPGHLHSKSLLPSAIPVSHVTFINT